MLCDRRSTRANTLSSGRLNSSSVLLVQIFNLPLLVARWDALGDGFGIESRARPRNARWVGLQGLNPLCVSVSAYIGMTAATVENLPGTGYKSVQMRLRDGLGPFAILRLFPIYPRERSDGRAVWGPRCRSPSLSCLPCEPWERCISPVPFILGSTGAFA